MFTSLAKFFPQNTQDIFLMHPEQLLRLTEAVWSTAPVQPAVTNVPFVHGNRPSLNALLKYRTDDLLSNPDTGPANHQITDRYLRLKTELPARPVTWQHLIYAYMLENTRMAQIFHRVLSLYAHGEELGTPSPETTAWLRNTEMLFYRYLPGFFLMSSRSDVRPDAEATRRNAYYRMFGMDLGHGTLMNKPFVFHKPQHANRDFVRVLEKLLYEIHQGLINRNNSSGINTTDYASMTNLFNTLANMLRLRRQGGNLSRTEFGAVAMMSWFHLTLLQKDFSLISDLGATAYSEEDRLLKIGKRVGMAANPRSGNYLQLGELLSRFLLLVEEGNYDDVQQVRNLFVNQNPTNYFPPLMTKIVTQWSIATGRNIKAQAVRA